MTIASDAPFPSSMTANGHGYTNGHANGNGSGVRVPDKPSRSPTSTERMAIAICGIGLRLPGGIKTGDDFWNLLVTGGDARSEIPASRFNIDGFDESLAGQGAIRTRHGYFLDDDLSSLDTSFFSMSRAELERCDPQQRQLLEVVRECLDDAGEINYRGQPVGCYIGTFGQDWHEMSVKESQHTGSYTVTGYGDLILANRVSYEYDLRGPSLVLKTGCSASLAALHEACRALQSGDASAAIVGGTSLIMGPNTTALFFNEGILSPDASCKTFDASADGFARAEGITAVYIKPLEAALRDGNPVRAVIRATGSNSDGRSQGLMNPSSEAHEALMRGVYERAGLDPRNTPFVECHGTGTATGDPIETKAVGNVFGERGVYIGSVKPNIGHSEGSSGTSSLIKAVLALEKGIIPPNIKFENPNPKIPFVEKKLTVPLKAVPFPADRAERISINSFGIGGSNAHVILDSALQYLNQHGHNGHSQTRANTIHLFSANSPASLKRQIDLYRGYTTKHPERAMDIGYTLALHREKYPHRAFAIVQDGQYSEVSSPAKAPSTPPSVTLIFSGQGAQWPAMGRELLLSNHAFRQDIVRMDEVLQSLKVRPSWYILEELLKPAEISQIHRAELAQPLSTALQVALVRHLQRLDISYSAVVGHSSGEIAAAYAAGYISLEYAITAAYYRGYVTTYSKAARKGGMMAAVGLGAADVTPYLQTGACVACENSPASTTISGDADAVQQVLSSIQKDYPETLARPLKVDMAYHSHHVSAIADEYLSLLQSEPFISSNSSTKSKNPEPFHPVFLSSVTCKPITSSSAFAPSYWVSNLVSPVRFSTAVSNLLASSPALNSSNNSTTLLLEIGPHSALAGPLRQICASLPSQPFNYIPTQTRHKDSSLSLLSAVGQLYQFSATMNPRPLFPAHSNTLPSLPPYPWDYSSGSFWYESRLSQQWRHRTYPHHCLLGLRVVESPDTFPQWRNVLHLEHVPWLADHKVKTDIVFPFAGYVAMAGEALRQITGGKMGTGYKMRHVVARTGLVISETTAKAGGVEMVTTLKRERLTDGEDSVWWEWGVESWNGDGWVKHCGGFVRGLEEGREKRDRGLAWGEKQGLERKVEKNKFYEAMERLGIVYGEGFQPLTDISASVRERVAEARVVQIADQSRGPFTLHPAVIDGCIQLLLVANVNGMCRRFQELVVPTVIEEIEISGGTAEMYAKGVCAGPGYETATVECVDGDGRNGLRMSGLRVIPLDGADSGGAVDVHAAARLQWLPDFDFADPAQLFTPPVRDRAERQLQEELTLLCILESAEKVADLVPCQPHWSKYRDWLHLQIEKARAGNYDLVDRAVEYLTLEPAPRKRLLEETYTRLLEFPGQHAATNGIKRISDHVSEIFTGQRDCLDILMQDDLLTEIYNEDSFGYSDFVRLLSNTRPNLRILEVGAGTGGTTEATLRHLVDESGFPFYSQYMFTDISAGFFPQARERFSYAANMEFQALDISRDAIEQGFSPASYDLIFAPNVIHATPSLKETLSNLKPLLKPDGMLLMTEISTVTRAINYIFGNFSGWWLGENDDRLWEPYVLPDRWDKDLKAAGYTGVDAVVPDQDLPYQLSVAILSKPRSEIQRSPAKAVTVLCQDPAGDVASSLISSLQTDGWAVTPTRLSQGSLPPRGQDIISCVDLETRFFDPEDMTEAGFAAFQALMRHLKDERLLWLTRPFQVKCTDPRAAQTLGVARTIRSELNLPLFTLELDWPQEPNAVHLVTQVFEKVRQAEDGDILNSDKEFIIDNGAVCVGRYHPFNLRQETFTSSSNGSAHGGSSIKSLHIRKPGALETLEWRDEPRTDEPLPLDEGMVEVDIHASGLNFKDVLLAMGVIPPHPSEPQISLGMEAAGIVRRVGAEKSKALKPEDRVMLLAPTSTLSTRVIAPAVSVVRIPDSLSLEAAATVPLCFATVMHSLLTVGNVKAGQTVLIHSAAGGIGLAAIQVCRAIGAEIFATVGSEQKVEFLESQHGIPRNRIFSSRDGSFLPGILRQTGNRGVDLVLNSLAGELLHASWACVAEYGMLIELGKRDLLGAGRLDMTPFLANRSYAAVDLMQFIRERPERMGEVLTRWLEMHGDGLLEPLEPVAYFGAENVEQAFRHLQNGDHIGKVVVTIPDDTSSIKSLPAGGALKLDPEATYLLVGGSKGLGRSIATWLAEQGARHLTFLSRSTGTNPESHALFAELKAMGCAVSAVSGSVDDKVAVEAAVSHSSRPVKGVFQLAMVLSDGPLVDMTYSQWNAAIGPKVHGTWNLHHALINQPLDFFWMASSLITVVDQPGQGNYSAGCAFLEAFCQYRHSLHLPATVLNICPVNGAGYVADNPVARKNMKAQGLYFLGEQEFLDFVRLNLLQPGGSVASNTINDNAVTSLLPPPWQNTGQILMGLRSELHLDDPNNRTNWRRDRRMGIYHNVLPPGQEDTKNASSETSALTAYINSLAGAEQGEALQSVRNPDNVKFLSRQIGLKIYELMLKPVESADEVDVSLTLAQVGLDSLMAIEMRRWFRRVFGIVASVLEIMGSASLIRLGELVAGKLGEAIAGVEK